MKHKPYYKMKQFLAILLGFLILTSCENKDLARTAPEIPPVETMVIDFGNMTDLNKSAATTKINWGYSALNVGIWSAIIGTTFAVPVAAFKAAFGQQPTVVSDLIWQWEYSVDGFTSEYHARLVGELESASKIKWEMFISKTGINSFDEFLWFEGTSNIDGKSGQWILYHSAVFPEKTIQIDWTREDNEVGQIQYTYVRERNDQRQADKFQGSTLTYGLQVNEFDAFVNIHSYDTESNGFADTYIEWSRSSYNGHVKSEHFFNDTNWHCWDSQGNDISCN